MPRALSCFRLRINDSRALAALPVQPLAAAVAERGMLPFHDASAFGTDRVCRRQMAVRKDMNFSKRFEETVRVSLENCG